MFRALERLLEEGRVNRRRDEAARRRENGSDGLSAEREVIVAALAGERFGGGNPLPAVRIAFRTEAVVVVGRAMADVDALDAKEERPRRQRPRARERQDEGKRERSKHAHEPSSTHHANHG